MNRGNLIFSFCVVGYLVGVWFTIAQTHADYHACLDQHPGDFWEVQYKACGDGSERLVAMVWPVYWFIRTATDFGGFV